MVVSAQRLDRMQISLKAAWILALRHAVPRGKLDAAAGKPTSTQARLQQDAKHIARNLPKRYITEEKKRRSKFARGHAVVLDNPRRRKHHESLFIDRRCDPIGFGRAVVQAQSDEANIPIYALPTEEVSAYRTPVQLRETTQSVTIINDKAISARNPASAVELFQQIPGIQIDQVGNAGGQGNIYIRGSEPNHTLILIDGVRLNDPTNNRGGGYDLSTLDLSSIDRIEVIRGAGSAIYGADAMGGIVNIVTSAARSAASADGARRNRRPRIPSSAGCA